MRRNADAVDRTKEQEHGRAIRPRAGGVRDVHGACRAGSAHPSEDPFYRYEGRRALAKITPGTVLKTRTLSYHLAGVPLPVTAVQLLYRSTGAIGQPTVNVTSVLLPSLHLRTPAVVSYQSFYDSLNSEDEPSYAISGGVSIGGLIPDVESGSSRPRCSPAIPSSYPTPRASTPTFRPAPSTGSTRSMRSAPRWPPPRQVSVAHARLG